MNQVLSQPYHPVPGKNSPRALVFHHKPRFSLSVHHKVWARSSNSRLFQERLAKNRNSTSYFEGAKPHRENGSGLVRLWLDALSGLFLPQPDKTRRLSSIMAIMIFPDDNYCSFAALFGQYNSAQISFVMKSSHKHSSGLYLERENRCPSYINTYPIIVLHMMNKLLS